MRRIRSLVAIAVLALVFFGSAPLVRFYTDALWFGSVGYRSVFFTSVAAQWLVGLAAGLITAVFVYANLQLAWSQARWTGPLNVVNLRGDTFEAEPARLGRYIWVVGVFAGLVGGISLTGSWLDVLRFFHATPFGVADPLFARDVSFYIFRLPLYETIYAFLFSLVLLTTLLAGFIYALTGGASLLRRQISLGPAARVHLTVLLGALLTLKAWGYWLDAYNLVYSARGVAFGASYADVHAQLPALRILLVLALVAAAGLFANVWLRRGLLLWGLPALVLVTSAVAGSLYPAMVQQFSVKPNELAQERPYIQLNINYTQRAYGLSQVVEKEFAGTTDLTAQDLTTNASTVSNVRLWDWQPLLATYAQLQEIRPYYDFKDVDIDRYRIADPTRAAGQAGTQAPLRQVMLSAREMNNKRLPAQGLTWVNQHLKYTHGFGLVMNPATEVDPEGLPHFWLQDLPPRSDVGLTVERPEIYYGETTDDYVVVRTREREFDYPMGDQNQETVYQGTGGVPIGSLLTRAAFASRLGSANLLISQAITGDSRLMIYRNIKSAVQEVAPFLTYDQDPYVVLDNGRLVWILDAYTTSGAYPYSEPFVPAAAGQGGELGTGAVNYARNSVKVTIDAYDGTMHFYLADPKDPIALTYQSIFPGLLRPLAEMPDSLKAHLRYPEDLFTVQAQLYATYHMTSPEVFYNREDTWALPKQVNTQRGNNQGEGPMSPYYTIMELPGEKDAEFVMMIPFTPGSRPNMISWLIARSDEPNYGQLLIYKLPKQETIYGPMQVEGRIDGDTTISQSLTLWSQSGSEVIRGNLLVVPVKDSVLYVEPLYLQATSNKLPELKRVIVSYADQVVMEPTLAEALNRIFGSGAPGQTGPGATTGPAPGQTGPGSTGPAVQSLIQQANQLYAEALAALKSGDWATYGDRINRLGDILRQLQGGGAPGPTTGGAPGPTTGGTPGPTTGGTPGGGTTGTSGS